MTRVQGPGGVDVSYTYDSAGRMLTRDDGTDFTTFEWDSWTLVNETTGSTVTRYIAPQGEILSFERGGQVYQVHNDWHIGSVRAITDSTGAVVAHYEYGAWGEVLGSSSAFSGGFSYLYCGSLGVRFDEATQLLYCRKRWYDAGLGRFLSRDAVMYPNRYAYVKNRPIDLVDPSGLAPSWYENPGWGPEGPSEMFPQQLAPPSAQTQVGVGVAGAIFGPALLGPFALTGVETGAIAGYLWLNDAKNYAQKRAREVGEILIGKGIRESPPDKTKVPKDYTCKVADDKFKHCVVSCYVARKYGPDRADIVGQGHEMQTLYSLSSTYDAQDIIANRLGIVFSKGTKSDEDCWTRCEKHFGTYYDWPNYPYQVPAPSDPGR